MKGRKYATVAVAKLDISNPENAALVDVIHGPDSLYYSRQRPGELDCILPVAEGGLDRESIELTCYISCHVVVSDA